MSAIKSVIPGSSQFLEIYPTIAEGVTAIAVSSPSGSYTKAISVSTHDLRKALGIDELGCGCDEADDNLKAAIKRAEDAEAFGAAAVTRAEEAEGDAREWKARAEKAEAELTEAKAALGRVEALIFGDNELIHASDLYAAIQPKPAFTLPTEAGAVVAYTDHEGGKQLWFRTRDTRRPWTDREGNTWHDAGLARDIAGDFTVLIGADQ